MISRLFLPIFLLLFALHASAQDEYERTLTITEWIKEMESCPDDKYTLKNAIIVDDQVSIVKEDSAFTAGDSLRIIKLIKARVTLRNCKFEGNGIINFYQLRFIHGIQLIYCEGPSLNFHDCQFGSTRLYECSFKSFNLYTSVVYENLSVIVCDFKFGFKLFQCAIIDTSNRPFSFFGPDSHGYLFSFSNATANTLTIESSTFRSVKSELANDLTEANRVDIRGDYTNLSLSNNNFEMPVRFSQGAIQNYFSVDNSSFTQLLFNRFSFQEGSTNFPWSSVQGNKLGLFSRAESFFATSDTIFRNQYLYTELLSTYYKFYSTYKNRGDLESANACYVELKNLETRKLAYQYEAKPTLTAYFSWKLNQFLKYFCDYGTSPVKSLIISMYVVLLFAFFYFFFYSDWDKINRSFLIKRYRKLLGYFTSEQRLEDFYLEDHKEEFESYEDFKSEMDEKGNAIPFYYRLVGKPLYHLSIFTHSSLSWMYRRTEILKGRWEDLSGGKKVTVGSVVFITLFIYGCYLVALRSLNSVFLSINTFSTLGFGDIPVRGISRYVAILEGFLGWFLLSIFSVSLISQILQN